MLDKDSKKQKLPVQEAINHASCKPELEPAWKMAISCFVAFFCFVVGVWLMPVELIPFRDKLTPLAWPPMVVFGWVQYWSVFAPETRDVIYHETVTITHKDGSMRLWEFPRMELASDWEHFKHEKLRKFFGDNIPWPDYQQFQPVVAKYIADACHDKNNPVVMITFTFNFNNNPPPDPKKWTYRNNLPKHIYKSLTFVYRVEDDKLVLDKS